MTDDADDDADDEADDDADIRRLDQATVERIAAGEVVERPASAVKELVENSLDADANRISVAAETGGTERLQVSDDGIGMDEDDLRRSVEEHTTSKIEDIGDLEGGVATLGFRGEALHAIGAVSRMTITSRPRGGSAGRELAVEGGEVTDVSPAGCPEGTTVTVSDLFFNVPARRKYLSQPSTEFSHVNTVVANYALANPDVAISLEHNGRETFATTGSGQLEEAILSVYGRQVADSMIDVDVDDGGGSLPEGPLESVSGLVSHPETNRATRQYLSTFVNGRYVTATTVRDAIVEAYGDQLGSDRYPFAVVFLELDPATVDVNVHPRKLEVRFAEEDDVRNQIVTAVRESLLAAGLIRSSAPRGRSAPAETAIDPGNEAEEVASSSKGERIDSTASDSSADGSSDSSAVHSSNSSVDHSSDLATPHSSGTSTDPVSEQSETSIDSTPRTSTAKGKAATPDGDTAGRSTRGGRDENGPTADDERRSRSRDTVAERSTAAPVRPRKPGKSPHRHSTAQRTLEGDELTLEAEYDTLPDLRVLGQLDGTYIVAAVADGLVLIDQHAADERVHYERLLAQFDGETSTQALAEPVTLELTAGEAAIFDTYVDALARLGFHAERIDDRQVSVRTVPADVAKAAGPELIRDVLGNLVSSDQSGEETIESVADGLLADLACHPSITGNTSLTEGSVIDLLERLDACENPWACPHGRPVLIHLDTAEIEDRFERDYPGAH